MHGSTHTARRLLVSLLAVAAIAAPAASAGTDIGIGIPAGRDSVNTVSAPPAASPSRSSDFQWGDAGIGAGLALGVTALGGGGVFAVRRQRGHLRTS